MRSMQACQADALEKDLVSWPLGSSPKEDGSL